MEAIAQSTVSLCDPDGFPQFIATIEKAESHYVEFSVREVQGFENGDKDKPLFDVSETGPEVYVRATIKWDGCSHVNFGEGGYLHLCGERSWQRHCKVMEWLYKLTPQYVSAFDEQEVWE